MKINFIIEICVGITVAILGVAYPIIIDRISNIGDKYSSDYLSEIFKKEYSQIIFKPLLVICLVSFLFLIFELEPLFGWDNWFINNSANLLTFSLSTLLVIYFFLWTSKILLFNGKPKDLLNYLIKGHNKSKEKNYYLKTINDFSYYAIKNQDEHIQNRLVEFYTDEFNEVRRNRDKKTPLVYPIDLYQVVFKIIFEIKNNQNYKLPVLEHRAVSGIWLLGNDFDEIPLSKDTYQWLWRNINLIADSNKFVRMYWSTAHQYFRFGLNYVTGEFNYENKEYENKEEIIKREKERNEFLEFHYALGGLLLFKENYLAIRDCFNFTQSSPPEYVLLPNNMTEIFVMYQNLMNEHNNEFIEFKYPFFDLNDNFGSELRYWISCYVVLLFIRQFTLHPFMMYHDFISQPILPDKIPKLNSWLRRIPFFRKCLNDILKKDDLIEKIGFGNIIIKNLETLLFFKFIDELEKRINDKIKETEFNIQISEEKLNLFKKSTGEIICKAFEDYSNIQNETDLSSLSNTTKFGINGLITLYPKEAFSDDIDFLGFDSSIANQIANQKIKYFIPNSFLSTRSVRYLFEIEDIVNAIRRLKIDEQYVIVAINPLQKTLDVLEEYMNIVKQIKANSRFLNNVLFILKKSNLPYTHLMELSKEEREINSLIELDKCSRVYTSVLDLNLHENERAKEKWSKDGEQEDLQKQVQISISFIAQIIWKKDIDVVQINIQTPFQEQGIPNELKDVISLKKE